MKLTIVAGARPNFMKIAPIMEALRPYRYAPSAVSVLLVHTGQHYGQKMSDQFFRDLQIPEPDVNLEVGSGSHAEQTARIMVAFERLCTDWRPDWVIVVGDVNSTMACAITAKKLCIRVAHVEAGLRSHDMTMPEEINRLCTDAVSDLLFTTDSLASENLRREGAAEEKIHFVGNTMIDTLLQYIDQARSLPLPCAVTPGSFAVLTLHRPSNVDSKDTMDRILRSVVEIAERLPVVFPVHPRTRKNLEEFGLWQPMKLLPNLHVTEPLSYIPFLGLVANARLVITDSGGIQEETTVLGIPCLTMRPNTERPITCTVGTNQLVGTDPRRIRDTAFAALDGGMRTPVVPEKWDGHASERIVDVLLRQGQGDWRHAERAEKPEPVHSGHMGQTTRRL